MNCIVINGKQHKLTSSEITVLRHYISCMYIDDILQLDIFDQNAVMIDTDTLKKRDDYKKFSNVAKAGVSLYHYLCEELDIE